MRSQKREEGSKQGKVRSDKEKREERREKREEGSLQRSKKGSLLGGPNRFYTTPPGKRAHQKPREASSPHRALSKKHQRASEGLFPKVLEIKGCHEDGRELESLHFYSVPWPPR